jgi:hypothetical protein
VTRHLVSSAVTSPERFWFYADGWERVHKGGWAPNIARMPPDRRIATLVAFAHAYEAETLDDALDLFDLLISDIAASAKTLGQKKRLRSLHDLAFISPLAYAHVIPNGTYFSDHAGAHA